MENNHDTERANTDPRPLESTQHAEPASVPAMPMANVFNRLGIRSTPRPEERQDDLVKALSSSEGPLRAAALQALGNRAEQGESLPITTVVAALHDPEWSVRAIAALTLRLGGERVPLEPLLDALGDEDESVRAAAARALGAMGARVPVKALEETLHDDSWRVREAAVLALGELGQRVPVEIFLEAARDSDEEVREAVNLVLRQRHAEGVVRANRVEKQNRSAYGQNQQQGARPADTHQRPIVVKRGPARRVVAVALAAALVIAGASTLWSLLLHSPGGGTPAHSTPAATRSLLFTFYGPGYTVLDPRGNLYVMDSDFQQTHTRILKFSPSGHLLNQWDHLDIDAQPLYIVVDGQGNLYATAQATNSLYKLSATGELLQKWQVIGQDPVGLALDQQDNLYVAVYGGNTIQKYSSTGKLLEMWGASGSEPGQFNHPVGVAVDGQGDLYVVDQGNNRIQKLTPSGKFIAQWGTTGAGPGQFLQPGSIAIDNTGNVYVTDGSTGLVQEFSSRGKLLAAWGAGGASALQFGIPRGVAVDDQGNIYVASVDLHAETFVNGRIIKFSSSGELLAVWK
ncbi:MAG TPA: HEAT repeat domain-containing protein [Ktedonobacteraceae bacterium]|nr:HEAT repeat domain-containing protein [Ktedonobacteraceae bacterium]